MKATETVWRQHRKKDISNLLSSPKLSNLPEDILQILMMRGLDTPELAEKFLYTTLKEIHSPFLMKDMDKGVALIKEAIEKNLNIIVYSDYDCDGATSGSVMTLCLKEAGANVDIWTNNRFVHGYGISKNGIDDMLRKFPNTQFIITTDNGISAIEGIQYAKDKGITVVVTDHHDPALESPKADAIINPKQIDCPYPFKGLCGAGVAYKVMLALYWEMNLPLEIVEEKLDIVALGTVADIVPLVDENRVIVKEGIKRIQEEKRPAFRLLRQETGVSKVDSQTLGFKYAPMINSLSRLTGDPLKAIEMFLLEDENEIKETVQYIHELNEQRKTLTSDQTLVAEKILDEKGLQKVNVIYHDSFHEGLVGLIASKLKEKYYRPFFVFAQGDRKGELKGSGRGIDGLHLKKTLDKVADLLEKYGGHTKAAGLSIMIENLEAFEVEMNKIADEEMNPEDLIPKIFVEIPVKPHQLTVELTESLEMLEPFGEAFQKPVVGVTGFNVNNVYLMGEERQHLKLISDDGIPLIMWSGGSYYCDIGKPKIVKAIGYPNINVWNGNVSVQFIVNQQDLREL